MRTRLVFDLSAAGLLLLAMAYHWQGNAFHEAVGLGLFGLVIAHNLFHRRWWGALAQPGGAVWRDPMHTGASLLLLGALLAVLVTGVMVSETALAFLSLGGGFTVRQVHGFVAYWVLVIVAVHIGLRWSLVMSATRGLLRITTESRLRRAALRLTAAGVVVAGVQAAGALGLRSRLMFEMSMDWWNFEASAIGFFAHCTALIGAVVTVTHGGAQALHALRQRRRRGSAHSSSSPQPKAGP